jgi:hypothetical protein
MLVDWRREGEPGSGSSVEDLESNLCVGSDFADGLPADQEFGSWSTFLGSDDDNAREKARKLLVVETLNQDLQRDVIKIADGKVHLRNCWDCGVSQRYFPFWRRDYPPIFEQLLRLAQLRNVTLPPVRFTTQCRDGDSGHERLPFLVSSRTRGSKLISFPSFEYLPVLTEGNRRSND